MRPQSDEYGEFYEEYVAKVDSENAKPILKDQMHETYTLINSLTAKQAAYRYAADKWTVKEVICHIVDSERIFAYRALCIARGEQKNLPGFNQEEYVRQGNFKDRSLKNIGDEYFSLRNATIAMFNSFCEETLSRKGKASGYDCSVRAIAFIIAGHERHHLDVLKDKYHVA